ncbi:MAG: hydrogen gas-evolving membrane-bound hydrogenase subunit E [Bacteroidales bacterium]
MEILLSVILGFMIIGAIFALHANDLLSAVIAQGIVGYGLVICFLHLKAPDLAIVQIVVETITLIIMVAVVLDSSRKELKAKLDYKGVINIITGLIFIGFMIYFFTMAISSLEPFGEHTMRMAETYVKEGAERTGAANLVTGVLWDFRGYDTLGEATILFTAALGVLTVLRLKGKK